MKNDPKQREKELLFKAPNCVLCWLLVGWKLSGCIMKGLLSMMRASELAFKVPSPATWVKRSHIQTYDGRRGSARSEIMKTTALLHGRHANNNFIRQRISSSYETRKIWLSMQYLETTISQSLTKREIEGTVTNIETSSQSYSHGGNSFKHV